MTNKNFETQCRKKNFIHFNILNQLSFVEEGTFLILNQLSFVEERMFLFLNDKFCLKK